MSRSKEERRERKRKAARFKRRRRLGAASPPVAREQGQHTLAQPCTARGDTQVIDRRRFWQVVREAVETLPADEIQQLLLDRFGAGVFAHDVEVITPDGAGGVVNWTIPAGSQLALEEGRCFHTAMIGASALNRLAGPARFFPMVGSLRVDLGHGDRTCWGWECDPPGEFHAWIADFGPGRQFATGVQLEIVATIDLSAFQFSRFAEAGGFDWRRPDRPDYLWAPPRELHERGFYYKSDDSATAMLLTRLQQSPDWERCCSLVRDVCQRFP